MPSTWPRWDPFATAARFFDHFTRKVHRRLQQSRQRALCRARHNQSRLKKIYDSYKTFLDDGYLWHQVADYTMETYMIRYRNMKT